MRHIDEIHPTRGAIRRDQDLGQTRMRVGSEIRKDGLPAIRHDCAVEGEDLEFSGSPGHGSGTRINNAGQGGIQQEG